MTKIYMEKLQTQGKNSETQAKNSKLKQKTQGLGGTRPLRVPKWC